LNLVFLYYMEGGGEGILEFIYSKDEKVRKKFA
jgi:hypothetical protein